jgi:hypothetical protein
MKTMVDFNLYDFVSKIKRNHVITLITDTDADTSVDASVSLELLSHYTNFFKEKKGLFEDNVYSVPFSTNIALEMFEHIHTLFTSLQHTNENLFKLLHAFDYFCIDVESVYSNILSKNISTDKMLQIWAKDALSTPSELSLKFVNQLYDKHFDVYSNFYPTNCKEILVFMLKKKWKTKYISKEEFLKRSSILETCLFDFIMHYINRQSKNWDGDGNRENKNAEENKENKEDNNKKFELSEIEQRERDVEFLELWKYIYPCLLSKDVLLVFSNTRYAKLIMDQLQLLIYQKLYIFSNVPIIDESRFCIDSPHLSVSEIAELSIGDQIQAMDCKHKWYNATVVGINETELIVHFHGFTDRYNESIKKTDTWRFLNFSTLCIKGICPCKQCITKIFDYKNNVF